MIRASCPPAGRSASEAIPLSRALVIPLDVVQIVIPTYNERRNVTALIERIAELYDAPHVNVLVVDDSSPDGTADAVRLLGRRFPNVRVMERVGVRGFSSACRDGMIDALDAGAEYVLMMDADFSHEPETIAAILESALEADLVIGSRYLNTSSSVANWSRSRLWLSRLANFYIRLWIRTSARDTTSGFRCWRSESLRKLPLRTLETAGYAFQTETLFHAVSRGAVVSEVENFYSGRTQGESKMTTSMIFESILLPPRLFLKRLLGRA